MAQRDEQHADSQPQVGTRRLQLDVRGERQSMAVRNGAAWVALGAGAWLMALPYPVPRAFALAGLVFAALWLVRAVRTRRRLLEAHAHYLELGSDGLRLGEGGTPLFVPWNEVESIAIDHDRLNLVVTRKNAPSVEIEPRYQGLNLHELGEAMRAALARARPSPAGENSRGAPGTQDG